MENIRLYLAYGSNLSLEQMALRCPDALPVGTAEISGYHLLFKGSGTGSYLTIEPKRRAKVPVAVWQVSEADEKRLEMPPTTAPIAELHQGCFCSFSR